MYRFGSNLTPVGLNGIPCQHQFQTLNDQAQVTDADDYTTSSQITLTKLANFTTYTCKATNDIGSLEQGKGHKIPVQTTG